MENYQLNDVKNTNLITNQQFIDAIFGGRVPEGYSPAICSKSGDPTKGGYSAAPATPDAIGRLSASTNNYVSNAAYSLGGEPGEFAAKKDAAYGVYALLVDDYGTKVAIDKFDGFTLSWLLETSPGNYQVVILLHDAISVADGAGLVRALINRGLSDPGATGGMRWIRLPNGVNGKPQHADPNTGEPFNCRLVEWNPEARYTPQEIVERFGLTIEPEREYLPPDDGVAPSDTYARAALESERASVVNAPPGQRNAQLNCSAYSIGQLVGAAALNRAVAEHSLFAAARASGLLSDEARKTIKSGLDAGAKSPRVMLGRSRSTARGETAPTSQEWPEPTPLPSNLLTVPALPIEILPDAIGPWVGDISDRMQCPPDFVAAAAMTALAAAIGCKVAIRPQRQTDWQEATNLWAMVIGRPGAMKSPAMAEALKPLQRLEAAAREKHASEMVAYTLDRDAYDIQRKHAQREGEKHPERARTLLEALIEPKAPVEKRLLVSDTTYEKLGEIIADNPDGVLNFRDELVALLRTLDREENAAARGFYLSGWNGTGGYTFDRITRGKKHMDRVCLSLLGSTQPARAAEYIRRAVTGIGDDGLIQRFSWMVWPDAPVYWREVDRHPDSAARQKAWDCFDRLANITPDAVGAEIDPSGGLPFLRLDDAASGVFSEWREDLERKLRSGELSPALESHLAKYRKLVPSLALINHFADGGRGPVNERALLRAVAAAVDYLEPHARRAYASGAASAVDAAKAILSRIRRGDLADGFTGRDLHRRGWTGLSDHEAVTAGLDLLTDYQWLDRRDVETGGRPSTVYFINPRAKS